MTTFTIDDFWTRRLARAERLSVHSLEAVEGWEYVDDPLDAFTEAPISVLEGEQGVDLADSSACPIIVVSAPGAVGKTTLARQIAHKTDSVYVDLASAVVPAGNTVTGALSKAGLLGESNKVALLIDALDEGRLKTTAEGFEDFFDDLADVSKMGVTIVLFGRAPAADEAWLLLQYAGVNAALLGINYYDKAQSRTFAESHLRSFLDEGDRPVGERHVRELDALIELVEESGTASDADRSYRGYAPVLQTVAELAANSADNVHGPLDNAEGDTGEELLPRIVTWVLKREQEKFHNNALQDLAISEDILLHLYDSREQLNLLVARAYGIEPPDVDVRLDGDVRADYVERREWWITNHPFVVDGGGNAQRRGREGGSLVARAVVDGWALRGEFDGKASGDALQADVSRAAVMKLQSSKANPLLWSWYVYGMRPYTEGVSLLLDASHVPVVYESLVAQVESAAELFIAENEAGGLPDIDMLVRGATQAEDKKVSGQLAGADMLSFGASISGVYVDLPDAIVRIGDGNAVMLQGPIQMACGLLEIDARSVQVGRFGRIRRDDGPNQDWQPVVQLRAESCEASRVERVPTVKGVEFEVAWPYSEIYPWSDFSAKDNEPIRDGQQRDDLERGKAALNQILRLFSRKGTWNRDRNASKYIKAVDKTARRHPFGEIVLEHLKREELVLEDGRSAFYELRLPELAAVMKMTREDFRNWNWSEGAEEFLGRALASRT